MLRKGGKIVNGGLMPYNLKAAGEFEANLVNVYKVTGKWRPLPKVNRPMNFKVLYSIETF